MLSVLTTPSRLAKVTQTLGRKGDRSGGPNGPVSGDSGVDPDDLDFASDQKF